MIKALRSETTAGISFGKQNYASPEEFLALFESERTEFLRLALLLTASAEDADCSLVRALHDCVSNGSVSRDWTRVWARRAVVRHAVQLVMCEDKPLPAGRQAGRQSQTRFRHKQYPADALQESLAILALSDFERLVYVICVIERYITRDCALLLNKSPSEVSDARMRAIDLLGSAQEVSAQEPAAKLSADSFDVRGEEAGDIDDSCGTILD